MVRISFTNYALTALVAFSGLIVGFIVARSAKEELIDGRKYFVFLQKILLTLVVAAVLYYFRVSPVVLVAGTAGVGFLLFWHFDKIPGSAIYPFLGVALAIGYGTEGFFTVAALIFLYGLPTAGILGLSKKRKVKLVLYHAWFLVVALSLYLFYVIR